MALAECLERLAAAGIEWLPLAGLETHYAFTRDGFVALVERSGEGFGATGSSGLLTERGFAALVWRDGRPFFVAKAFEQEASLAEIDRLRAFASDLDRALR
ncbi:MAG TPA: hypothetical protein VF767_11870 [Bryobacteraceae bacterium]